MPYLLLAPPHWLRFSAEEAVVATILVVSGMAIGHISTVQDSFTSLFEKPTPLQPDSGPKRRKPFEVPQIFLPIYLPLLLIVAAISVPVTYLRNWRVRRSERKFREQMRDAGRLMTWDEFELALIERHGTTIEELLSIKGPVRLWWTPEDVRSISPTKCPDQTQAQAFWFERQPSELQSYFEWCFAEFTNPRFGGARLVQFPERKGMPEAKRKEFTAKLAEAAAEAVPACSFRAVRGKRI